LKYLITFKASYLILIAANVILVVFNVTGRANISLADRAREVLVGAVFFFLNAAAWWGFWNASRAGYYLERTLSIGRMMMDLAVAAIVTIQVAYFSPTTLVLWMPIVELGVRVHSVVIEIACLILLALEILFFRRLKQHWSPRTQS
jgi:hypothetical protein